MLFSSTSFNCKSALPSTPRLGFRFCGGFGLMGRRDRNKAKRDEEAPMKPVVEPISSDDDEANEDLSLKIVQKSLAKRAGKSSPDGFVFEDVDDIGKVVRGGTSDPVVVLEVEDGKGKRKSRKKKRSKVEKSDMEEKAVVAQEEEVVNEVKTTGTVESTVVNAIKTTDKVESAVVEEAKANDRVEDSNAVEIPDNIVLRKLLRGPRYFDPPDNNWGTCYNCGEEGHNAVNCTMARRKKPCFVCGSFEHGVRNCTKGHDCFICKKGGHRAKDCPDKYNKSFKMSQICLKCGGSSHEMFSCKNDYSPDDLKEIQCYVCKKFGHLCCINSADADSRDVSCYRCGQLGHTGLACNRVYGETTVAASPNLCFKCGEGGHFARECTSSAKTSKRTRDFSTPFKRFSAEDNDHSRFQSAPDELVKARKKKKTRHDERVLTTSRKSKHRYIDDPEDSRRSKHKYIDGWSSDDLEVSRKSKHRDGWSAEDPGGWKPSKHRGGWSTEHPGDWKLSKHRGGWSTEDPEDFSYKKPKRSNWVSPATPTGKGHRISALTAGGHLSSSPDRTWKNRSENSPSQGYGNGYRHHRYSASRFGNSNNNNDGERKQYDWRY